MWILLNNDRKIPKRALRAIYAPGVDLVVSVVTIWEILLKRHAGKLWIDESPATIVRTVQAQDSWRILPLGITHFQALNDLAQFSNHTDPFDRMLIAQALSERLSIVSADPHFSRYGVEIVW